MKQYLSTVTDYMCKEKMQREGEGETCIETVVKIMEKMDCGLSASDIDRAHCVGPKKPVKVNGEVTGIKQQMIVKVVSFRQHTLMYKKRKAAGIGVKIRLDLTKKRLRTLNQAIDFAKESDAIDFVFCDINCNPSARLKDGGFVLFDSVLDLQGKIHE